MVRYLYAILLLALVILLAANLVTNTVTPTQLGITNTAPVHGQKWRVHDMQRPQPKVVAPANGEAPVLPPSDAVVLFNGENLDQFRNKELRIENGAMIMGPGGQETIEAYGDIQLHVEWSAPNPPQEEGQDRGNSGILLMGLYELQVLDSYQSSTYPDGQAAALYGQHPPMVNASKAPGQWQTYDIFFRAPRFNDDKTLASPAYATVVHNGVLVQFHHPYLGPARWRSNTQYHYHAEKLPLSLQWHRSPVRYRNIWIRPLDEYNALDAASQVVDGLIEGMEALSHQQTASLGDAVRLSTEEIKRVFADVRDEAQVQDSAGTRAVNYWYADGRFINEWSSPDGSGRVTGRWRAKDGRRCVLIRSGLPDRIGKEICGPVYRRGQTYLSLNPDGSIHGMHTLAPLDTIGR